jgi:hypothetical protein
VVPSPTARLTDALAGRYRIERFVVEIKTTAAMSHPHILPLFDSGTADGFLFYVMPFIEGETIRDRLNRETQFGVKDAIRIAREVADALDYAHRHGVIHRDIKPENILLYDGRAMVMDFGIALAVSAAAGGRMTETGLLLGTPHYMSPEQATAEKEITTRSDVYSLASVLYEMLAGEPPHTAGSAQAVIMKIVTDVARPVNELRRNVPPNVVAALAKALEKLPADRFSNAKDFGDALANPHVVNGSAGGRGSWRGRLSAPGQARAVMRHPVTLALAVAALGGIGFGVKQWMGARGGASGEVVEFAVDTPAGLQLMLSGPGGSQVSISPDGSAIIGAAADATGSGSLYLRELHQAALRPLQAPRTGSFFSPDGATIGCWIAGRLQRMALAGGALEMIGEMPPGNGVTWTRGGDLVLKANGESALQRVASTGGSLRQAAQLDSAAGEKMQMYPVALPDGEHILYASWGSGGLEDVRIGVLNLSSGTARRTEVRGTAALGMLDGRLI